MGARARWIAITFCSALALGCGREDETGRAPATCPAGTRLNPELATCAAVHDARAPSATALTTPGGLVLPDLAARRAQRSASQQGRRRSLSGPPVPGGIGSGVTYAAGGLKVTTSSSLYTHMAVYPEGVGQLGDWLFTTATNRTEKTLEIVGIYDTSSTGSLGVYDWSCSATSPCQNNVTSPSWVVSQPLRQRPCNTSAQNDGGDHKHLAVYYENAAESANGEWKNSAYLWNYCTSSWDLVYEHAFADAQRDCSIDNSCGWWGPIFETFQPDPQPDVAELGFWGTSLIHDGISSDLGPTETSWSDPAPGWSLFHRTANSAFSAGGHVSDLNRPPTVAGAATATPNPVKSTTTALSSLGADDDGEQGLTYTWSAEGPATVTFTPNGSNAAKATTAVFRCAGVYRITDTIRDGYGASTSSAASVTVSQALTTLSLAPSATSLLVGETQLFSASGSDQFGDGMAALPSFTWAASGGGTIDGGGGFTASTAGGPYSVTASAGALTAGASVTVTSKTPTVPTPAGTAAGGGDGSGGSGGRGGCSSTGAPGAGAVVTAVAVLSRRRKRSRFVPLRAASR